LAYANLAVMHRAMSERLGARTALRYKRDGLYHDLSWRDYRRRVDGAAAGLVELGVAPGDTVGILSENRHEWLAADLAILSAGAADVPLHAPLSPAQVQYQLAHSGAKGVVVSGQAQADKVLAMRDALPDLEWLVAFDPVDLSGRIRSLSWEGLIERGWWSSHDQDVLRREVSLTRDDLATIIYTSGTTGPPKGVMLSHGNLLSNAEATVATSSIKMSEVLLSWLPYSHIYARTCDHYVTAIAGALICLAESMDTLIVNLAETEPTWMTAVPRFYEKVWAAVEAVPPEHRAARLRAIFGSRLWQLSSGGAPLPRHVGEGFERAGIPLLEGYGLTESSPCIAFNTLECHKLGTVGRPMAGVEVRIAADGEILTRGPHVMMGYWKDPEATRAAVVDGWLHTGDVGFLDAEGYLTITDRKKDLIITSGGKNIAPSELERLLTSDPYIDQAVTFGDRKPFVSALIVPNLPLLEKKASELGCRVEVDGDFIRAEPLHDFFVERVARVMDAVSQPERVRAFLILARPFRVEADELTATLKVRRKFVLEKYKARLEELYTSAKLPKDLCP
jgi:long-chain acyl-CoA synthetase